MLSQSTDAETLGLRSRRALSFPSCSNFTHSDLEIQTSKYLNLSAQGRVNLIRPEAGQFESTGDTLSREVD